ncbi:hypothetical protein [Alkalibacter mobilis]|uniref:hypothetical protein n=1 Tax=Alkalibacter mobilis TaxID=2787712 RepID=UPI00189FB383|nr:hypothetical protein [Alkalibacter mobilis]MBF7097635.1 hypothetical protein [Alkalibacter mobilis]
MKSTNFFSKQFDYEEDDYDKLAELNKRKSKYDCFTNKSTKKKPEFDYEEDPYEP